MEDKAPIPLRIAPYGRRVWPEWLPFIGFRSYLIEFDTGLRMVTSLFTVAWLGKGTATGTVEILVDDDEAFEQD